MNQTTMRRLLLTLWLILPIGTVGAAEPDVAGAVARVAQQVDELASRPEIAGLAIVVADSERVLYQQTYGVRQVGERETVDPKTRFRIASLSKGFASTLATMLVAEGVIGWEHRVSKDVDYFRLANGRQASLVNVEHLLSHRVGLPHNAYDRLLEANWQVPTIVSRYERVELMCPVGSCYGYQNVSYNLITDVVAARTGLPYESLVKSRILEPLQMRGAGLGGDHLELDDNFARPHVRKRSRAVPVGVKYHYYRVPAAAGINLTLDDLAIWLQAQLGTYPDVLSPELLDEMRTPRVRTRREMIYGGWRGRRLEDAWYGLGWRVYDYAGHPMVYHAGAVEGYRAQIAILPEADIGIAAMWNSESSKAWGIVPVFADALFGLRAEDWMKLRTSGAGRSAD